MRNTILISILLSLTSLVFADVTITATCEDAGNYTLSYTADANLPRGFALDIEVSAGTITNVNDFSTDYDIYPGSIVIEDGQITDYGSPICDSSYPDTLGGIGTSGVTIEMASLYAQGETSPSATGMLCTFTISDPSASITITENAIRAGVVMEDPEEDPALTIDVEPCSPPCPTCLGDIDGNDQVDLTDLTLMVNILVDAGPPYIAEITRGVNDCADMNENNTIDLSDLTIMVNMLSAAGGISPPYTIFCNGGAVGAQ